MMTLRRYLTAQYDWTGLSSRIYRSPAFETAALSVVAGLVLALIILYHLYIEHLSVSVFRSTSMGMEHMFPRITYFTLAVFLIPMLFVLSNAWRMFRLTMRRGDNRAIPLRCYLAEVKTLVRDTFADVQVLKCAAKDRKERWAMHGLLAFGCGLMIAIKLFFLRWFQTDKIYPIYHPQRWLGYLAAAFIIAGAMDILVGRFRQRGRVHRPSEWGDLTLPVLLLLTALSGVAAHIFRYTGLTLAAHYTYAVHLMIVVPMLIVEVPFGHWSHMIYRPMALYFAAVQARALEERKNKEGLAA
jgi:heterodisulfide reductase subunit C/quinone-modifying oxidoreductase subunit QmoC